MGIRDLLLRKGRGIGELKKFGTEHSLNADVLAKIKELDQLDEKARNARSKKDYGALLSCISKQLNLIDQVDYYALVRLIRLEYDYKDIKSIMDQYEGHYREEEKKLRLEERKAGSLPEPQKSMVRRHINEAKKRLDHFRGRIKTVEQTIKSFKKIIRERCKKKIIKAKTAYHFA